jgi:hypothetical protein
MAFRMACPNFKKGLKMVSGPLGVKVKASSLQAFNFVILFFTNITLRKGWKLLYF